jgi:GH24 family phage-related lysozyme (muramidase)
VRNWRVFFREQNRGPALPARSFAGYDRPVRQYLRPDFGADAGSIKEAQHYLNVNGYASPPLAEDGDAGPLTQAATKRFQYAKGLTVDGQIGPQTLGAMGIKAVATVAKPIQRVNGPSIPGLRQVVTDSMPDFNGRFEGKALPYPYTDSKGYVTTGTGNLIDPVSVMLALPWTHGVGGAPASQQDIIDAFSTLKNAWPGVQSTACASLTDLRLSPDALNSLLYKTVKSNQAYLAGHIPNMPNQPADAQLAHHSMSWAWGAGFTGVWGANGQKYLAALANGDYNAAADAMLAANAHEQTINPGIVPRVAATEALLRNAAAVAAGKGNPDNLYWPGGLIGQAISAGNKAMTVALGVTAAGAAGILAYNKIKKGKWSLDI